MLASRAVTAPRAINLPLTLLQTNPVAGYLVLSESGMLSVGSDWIRPDSRPRIPDPPAAVISLRMPVVMLGAPTAFCSAATVEAQRTLVARLGDVQGVHLGEVLALAVLPELRPPAAQRRRRAGQQRHRRLQQTEEAAAREHDQVVDVFLLCLCQTTLKNRPPVVMGLGRAPGPARESGRVLVRRGRTPPPSRRP